MKSKRLPKVLGFRYGWRVGRRREKFAHPFIVLSLCASLGAWAADSDMVLCPQPKADAGWRARAGAWIANVDSDAFDSREKLAAKISMLKSTGITEIYPVAWNKGTLLFHAPELQARLGQSPFYNEKWRGRDLLREVIEEARKHGLKVYAWFESGLKIPAGMDVQKQHPDWFMKTNVNSYAVTEGGVQLAHFDPARVEVQALYADMFRYVVEHYDLDGVQVDDHLSVSREWGYENSTLLAYLRETGRTPPRVIPPPNTPASNPVFKLWNPWMQWKADRLTRFMEPLVAAVRTNPKMKFQASPHPHPWTVNVLGQDWTEWVRREWVDDVIAQVYREGDANYSFALRNPGFVGAKKCVPILVGVYAGQKNRLVPTEKVLWQIGIARDFMFEGVAFFNAETVFQGEESPVERGEKILDALTKP